ncbi:MAG: hypothetical protein M3552_03560 [Planctomycetota bacterium]|nr:hypothetical protein [Planctomycetota bacterium]
MPATKNEANGKSPSSTTVAEAIEKAKREKDAAARVKMLGEAAYVFRMTGREQAEIEKELAELCPSATAEEIEAAAADAAKQETAELQQHALEAFQQEQSNGKPGGSPNPLGDDADDVPTEEEIAELQRLDGPLTADPGPLPAQLLKPGGLLGRIVDFTCEIATKPNPPLALAGAFALMGTLLGRKVTANGGKTHAKVYALAITDTAGGKECPRQVNVDLLSRAGEIRLLGGANLNSHAGVISMLSEWPVRLVQIDELGRYMAQANGRHASQHVQTAITSLLTLYTGKDYLGETLKDRKTCRPVLRHHMSVLGSSTPAAFFDALSPSAIADGLLGRCMIFPGERDPEFRIEDDEAVRNTAPPDHLVAEVASWINWRKKNLRPIYEQHEDDGDASGPLGVIGLSDLHPFNVPTDKDAAEHLLAFCNAREAIRRTADQVTRDLIGRDFEKARRVALIVACSSGMPDENKLRITLCDGTGGLHDPLRDLSGSRADHRRHSAERRQAGYQSPRLDAWSDG